MANGTLKVQNIETSSGSGTITLGQSGETIALGSGVTSKLNQPAFEARRSSNQAVTSAQYNKVQFDTEIFDTDGAYDNATNYRFTVPAGKAGKYFIYANVDNFSDTNTTLTESFVRLYINGAQDTAYARTAFQVQPIRGDFQSIHVVRDLSVGDYIEIYQYAEINSGNLRAGTNSMFGAYRLGAE